MKLFIYLTFAFVATLFCACQKEPGKIISTNPSEFSAEDQLKIGDAFKAEMDANPPIFKILSEDDFAEAHDYLRKLLNTLVQTAPVLHRVQYDWTANIIHDDSLAVAYFLPGGHFYISTGLLKYVDNESQLLGIIGHELHYADTDLMVQAMRSEFGGTTLGDILLDNAVENISELAAAMPGINFNEEDVLKADEYAIELICPFLYEPLGLNTILEKNIADHHSIQWLENRFSEIENRMQQIENQAIECGLPGVLNEEAYWQFKQQFLP